MALLVILTSLSFPILSSALTELKLNSDASTMAGVLRMARTEAITSGASKQVVFYVNDSQNPRYLYVDKSSYKLSPGVRFVGNKPFNSKFKNQPACIFMPNGRAVQGGTVTLKAGNKTKYVIVLNTTGRIRTSDTPPESWEDRR
jgi:Tfp pilus assembly protein FimT